MQSSEPNSIYTPLSEKWDDESPYAHSLGKIAVMRPEDVEERLGNRQEDDPKWGASLVESMNFEEPESAAWRKHHLRRYSANKERVLTHATKSTMYKWALVVLIGIIVACIGLFVTFLVNELVNSKFNYMKDQMAGGDHVWAYFSLLLISLAYALSAGLVCWAEPCAAGSGIPEVKAYLNGVNLHKHVRVRTLLAKVVGMCFSTSSGLPIGKEGPMIHAGSVVGAALSQGKTRLIGVDTSWTKYQDLRNDRSKRDFVTFGAASGVAAAFSAPIGGILFTLEEGASFWNPTITFRGFFAAMMTELTINLVTGIVNGARQSGGLGVETTTSMFDFGSFDNFEGYHIYELFIFMLMGVCGGCIGAWFNHYTLDLANRRNVWLQGKANPEAWRVLELLLITFVWTTITFVLPLIFRVACTEKPLETDDWTDQANTLLDELVQFQCPEGHFNQLASLTLVNSDVTLQQFFHFQYSDGSKHGTFDWWVLLLFFLFYFGMAVVAAGSFCPAGLFVPTLVSGAALGRLLGHFLNFIGHGYVTDSGTYSLLGAAAVLGGMSRMTICGVVIMLEASGKNEFLLPLMLVFAAARYTGNVWNQGMYDMQIALKGLPFLEAHLKNIGLLNLHPVKEVMTSEVKTLRELNRVSEVEHLLANTTHNAFPVLSHQGHVKGLILRKHLAILMKLKVFSYPSEHATGWTSTGRDSNYSNYTVDCEEDEEEAAMYADRTGNDSEGTWRRSFGSSNGPSPRASSGGNTKFSEGGLTLAAGTCATTGEALTTSEDLADRAHSGGKHADTSGQQPQDSSSSSSRTASVSTAADARAALLQRKQTVSLSAANAVHFETIEKGSYPKYPNVKDIKLNPREKAAWLDLRQYMDSAPYVLNEKSSIQKAYRYFRTLGLRHLLCVDYQNRLTGILTRADLQESRLEQFWLVETDHVGNFQRIDGDAKPMEDFYVDEILSGNNLIHTVNSPLTMGATLSSDMSASEPTSVSAGDSSGQTLGEGGGDIEAGTSPGGQLQASALASIASAIDYASFPLHKNE